MSRKASLLKSKNFCLYYGYGETDSLSEFDLVILEPGAVNIDEIKKLKQSGTLLLAYVSVMEIHPASPDFKYFFDNDFIKTNGVPLINEFYGTYIVDLESKRWTNFLLHKIGQLVVHNGFDGIFLDTIGNVEHSGFSCTVGEAQLTAAADFVAKIRKHHPDILIFQNNGLNKLCDSTARYIDGICWENPPFGKKSSTDWVKVIMEKLKEMKKHKNIQVLILLEESFNPFSTKRAINKRIKKLARSISLQENFLMYEAPGNYVKGINKEALKR